MEEIWKPIKGYENLYQVSNLGNVKSLKTEKNLYYTKSGKSKKYLRVGLFKNKKRTMFSIHRLVAETFIPNPNNLEQVNHKDEKPNNNCVNNLEWVSCKENINYGTKIIRTKSSNLLYYLKRDYSYREDIIEIAEKLNAMIKEL